MRIWTAKAKEHSETSSSRLDTNPRKPWDSANLIQDQKRHGVRKHWTCTAILFLSCCSAFTSAVSAHEEDRCSVEGQAREALAACDFPHWCWDREQGNQIITSAHFNSKGILVMNNFNFYSLSLNRLYPTFPSDGDPKWLTPFYPHNNTC